MSARLPSCRTLLLKRDGPWLQVTLNRPEARNALNEDMIADFESVLDYLDDNAYVRAVFLRGAGGVFCAGGDIKGFKENRELQADGDSDPVAEGNLRYGRMLSRWDALPLPVVALIEGPTMGGGLGLTCVADVAVATRDATFGLPEATLGLPASQVCLFLVRRIGLTAARRLAATSGRMGADEARALGLIHEICDDGAALDARLEKLIIEIGRGATDAIAETKRLMLAVGTRPLSELQSEAAKGFAEAMRGPTAGEGVAAFLEKRPASWAVPRRDS